MNADFIQYITKKSPKYFGDFFETETINFAHAD
jgi:hypothetical protein